MTIQKNDPRLTAYVLNEISYADKLAVEKALLVQPELKIEILKIKETLGLLSLSELSDDQFKLSDERKEKIFSYMNQRKTSVNWIQKWITLGGSGLVIAGLVTLVFTHSLKQDVHHYLEQENSQKINNESEAAKALEGAANSAANDQALMESEKRENNISNGFAQSNETIHAKKKSVDAESKTTETLSAFSAAGSTNSSLAYGGAGAGGTVAAGGIAAVNSAALGRAAHAQISGLVVVDESYLSEESKQVMVNIFNMCMIYQVIQFEHIYEIQNTNEVFSLKDLSSNSDVTIQNSNIQCVKTHFKKNILSLKLKFVSTLEK